MRKSEFNSKLIQNIYQIITIIINSFFIGEKHKKKAKVYLQSNKIHTRTLPCFMGTSQKQNDFYFTNYIFP